MKYNMKAEIKIPKGYVKVRVGYLAVAGDLVFACHDDMIKVFPHWQPWKANHQVRKNEVFIRKVEGARTK